MIPKIANRKEGKKETLYCMFSHHPLFTMWLLPLSVSHGPLKSWFTFTHNQCNFFFLCQYIYLTISCQNPHAFPLPKCTGASTIEHYFHKQSSQWSQGLPWVPQECWFGSGVLGLPRVFAQHWRQGHYSFRKAFHIPDLKKHHKLLDKNMCKWYDGDRLGLFSQILIATFCRYIFVPLRSFIAVQLLLKKTKPSG